MEQQKLKIIVDTREQQPLTFAQFEHVETGRDTLGAGDYTIVGQDMPGDDFSVIVERKKDAKELAHNLGKGWDRFLREAEILATYKVRQIVVCGPDNFHYLYDRGMTKMHPSFCYKRLTTLLVDYNISTIFLPTRELAENYIFRLFYEMSKRLRDSD